MKTNEKMRRTEGIKWYPELRNVGTGNVIDVPPAAELTWKMIAAERTAQKASRIKVGNVVVAQQAKAFIPSFISSLAMIKSVYAIILTSLAAVALFSCSDESLTLSDDTPASSLSFGHDRTASFTQNTLVPYTYESLTNGTVKLSFENMTGYTINGDLIREGISFQQNGTILAEFTVTDGSSHIIVDDNVIPGETYRYIFEYIVDGANEYIINFDTVTVLSTVPALGNFLLLPPIGDEAYDFLFDNQTIVIAKTNIAVETDHNLTRSVVFILNGATYTDNNRPFTLFPGRSANLQNGSYRLSAIAYPKKNGKGVAGDTTTVSFTVNNLY